MFSGIRTVFLDLDNTLWWFSRNSAVALAEVCARYAVSRLLPAGTEAFVSAYERVNADLWHRYHHGEIGREDLLGARYASALRQAGYTGADADDLGRRMDRTYLDLLAEQPLTLPGAREALQYLTDRGYTVGVLSNGFKSVQRRKLESGGLSDLVPLLVLSDDCGVTKPRRGIFDYALRRAGGTAAFIDAEHALDPDYARRLGVDVDNLLISQPDNGEQALEICDALVRSGAIDIIVIDSVAALVPRAEIEGDMGDSHVGLQARLMSQALRKLTGIIAKSKCATIFINQIREKVGIMFGNPETTTGGRALKFYSTIRLEVRKVETIKNGNDMIGSRTRIKVVKNKVAPPFKQAEFDIMYGQGISKTGCLVDLGVDLEVLQKSGAWFSYGDTRIGQGREKAKDFLRDNPEIAAEIEARIRELTVNKLLPPKDAEGVAADVPERQQIPDND